MISDYPHFTYDTTLLINTVRGENNYVQISC